MTKIDWESMYPEGFISCFSLRRVGKNLHKRIKRLALENESSVEFEAVMALEAGIAMREMEALARED